MKFTVKNFKSFDSTGVSLDLRGINVLTGTNSSGKSSYVKAFLLLSDFLQQLRVKKDAKECYLRFSNSKLNLGTYQTAVHAGTNSNQIEFEYEVHCQTTVVSKNPFHVSLSFSASDNTNLGYGKLVLATISYNGEEIFRIQGDGGRFTSFKGVRSLFLQGLTEAEDFLEDLGLNQSENKREIHKYQSVCILPVMKEVGKMSAEQFKQFCNRQYEMALYDKSIIDKYGLSCISKYRPLIDKVVEVFEESTDETIWDFLRRLECNYNRRFRRFSANDICCHALIGPEIETLSDGTIMQIPSVDEGSFDVKQKRCDVFELVVALLYWLSYHEEIGEHDHFVASLKSLNSFVKSLVDEVLFNPSFYPLVYLPSEKATVKRLYSMDGREDVFQEVLLDYFKACERYNTLTKDFVSYALNAKEVKNFRPGDFVNKWIRHFSIGDHLKLCATNDGLGVVLYLFQSEDDSSGRLLADEGYGISQLISILLSAETCILKGFEPIDMENLFYGETLMKWPGQPYKYKIFIEEPEIHLHPKLQSYLADMLWELLFTYRIRTIVETHSEYLVRKLQVLFARYAKEKSLDDDKMESNCPTRVFYFEKGKGAYDMKIRPDGKFSNEFGSGFFDEASNLVFDIL